MNHLRTLSEYATFKTVSALNEAVATHQRRCEGDLSPTSRIVLRFISQHAVKYPGSSMLKVETIAESLCKSKRTIQRALSLLEKLNIISRIPLFRAKRGGNGANIIIVMAIDTPADNADSRGGSDEHVNFDNEAVLKAKPKYKAHISNGYNDNQSLRDSIPDALAYLTTCYDFKTAYECVGAVYRAKASVDPLIVIEQNNDAFIQLIKSAVQRFKRVGKGNVASYLYVAVRGLCTQIKRAAVMRNRYDWLVMEDVV